MNTFQQHPIVYVVSDSVGETAELVIKAAASQFGNTSIEVRRIPYVEDKATINEVVAIAKDVGAMIAFTLVVPEVKNHLITTAERKKVETVDIMGPILDKLTSLLELQPKYKPGLVYRLDEEYFRKVEAIEFAVKYDDGRDPRGVLSADIVLIGVSRTSKTPLSQYLAHKGLKVANVPIVPELEPPEELFRIMPEKCIGLQISPEKLHEIRSERLKSLGLKKEANYASMKRIHNELSYSDKIMKKIGCSVIDVSNKAVEETANVISNHFTRK
ncbi:hypothetical protein HNR44_000793 [Geomicrobium halophilum]|uniref:Putative pyruvate, phosphate dikinase regulatory protein n=1 Tax=Geomicrobium halophilum TaxID=549000 RepID=A0A841PMB1_9BACL|nr:pyruvate, water dikinase regulatory protein [Geomicrobium halophilum]MBB6448844.1 hypothetical protein [Geomicrobium halophilum]